MNVRRPCSARAGAIFHHDIDKYFIAKSDDFLVFPFSSQRKINKLYSIEPRELEYKCFYLLVEQKRPRLSLFISCIPRWRVPDKSYLPFEITAHLCNSFTRTNKVWFAVLTYSLTSHGFVQTRLEQKWTQCVSMLWCKDPHQRQDYTIARDISKIFAIGLSSILRSNVHQSTSRKQD